MMETVQNACLEHRIATVSARIERLRSSHSYYWNQPIEEASGGAHIVVNGRDLLMHASYSYLGLIGHPRINRAARKAVEKYGTGTHGVRSLGGSLPVHADLEQTIAGFKGAEAAVTFSSGYVANMAVIATLVRRGDFVFSDRLNHSSIVQGCELSRANHIRFKHNDVASLERRLKKAPREATKLVVADGVFSMDGDVAPLPAFVELCRRYSAWLMIDEAHSTGILGRKGRGIEEHFGMPGVVDIKMGTLSKVIPSVGGYIAGKRELVDFIRHECPSYIMSAALPPAQAAAADEAFRVIMDEPWRVERLRANTESFINGLKARGLDTHNTVTAIVPIICRSDDTAIQATRLARDRGVFVCPVVSPAVPPELARLRATVTSAHEAPDIERAMDVLADVAGELGVVGKTDELRDGCACDRAHAYSTEKAIPPDDHGP